jgi:hypothetical protein
VFHLFGHTRIGLVAAVGAFTLQYAPRHVSERSPLFMPSIAAGLAASVVVGCSIAGHRAIAPLAVAVAEVLDRQPEPVRRLLLRTSILDRVNGELAGL